MSSWAARKAPKRALSASLRAWNPWRSRNITFGGTYYYGSKDMDRWLQGEWKDRLLSMRANLASLEKMLPSQYAFLHAIKDTDHPANTRIQIRGEEDNL